MEDSTLSRNKQDVSGNHLFVYGTLQSGESRNQILKGLAFSKAILPGYKKISPPELGFPFIVEDMNAAVKGEIYFDLSLNHWKIIDQIEGEGALYHRIKVHVEIGDIRNKIPCYVYYPSKSLINSYYMNVKTD